MAYNNFFPSGYPQMYGQNYMPQQNTAQNNAIIWVQGEAGAKSYLIAPNSTATLWDSEAQTIYIKSADASGMPSIKVLDYTIRDSAPRKAELTAQNEFATKDEVESLRSELEALRAELTKGETK